MQGLGKLDTGLCLHQGPQRHAWGCASAGTGGSGSAHRTQLHLRRLRATGDGSAEPPPEGSEKEAEPGALGRRRRRSGRRGDGANAEADGGKGEALSIDNFNPVVMGRKSRRVLARPLLLAVLHCKGATCSLLTMRPRPPSC